MVKRDIERKEFEQVDPEVLKALSQMSLEEQRILVLELYPVLRKMVEGFAEEDGW